MFGLPASAAGGLAVQVEVTVAPEDGDEATEGGTSPDNSSGADAATSAGAAPHPSGAAGVAATAPGTTGGDAGGAPSSSLVLSPPMLEAIARGVASALGGAGVGEAPTIAARSRSGSLVLTAARAGSDKAASPAPASAAASSGSAGAGAAEEAAAGSSRPSKDGVSAHGAGSSSAVVVKFALPGGPAAAGSSSGANAAPAAATASGGPAGIPASLLRPFSKGAGFGGRPTRPAATAAASSSGGDASASRQRSGSTGTAASGPASLVASTAASPLMAPAEIASGAATATRRSPAGSLDLGPPLGSGGSAAAAASAWLQAGVSVALKAALSQQAGLSTGSGDSRASPAPLPQPPAEQASSSTGGRSRAPSFVAGMSLGRPRGVSVSLPGAAPFAAEARLPAPPSPPHGPASSPVAPAGAPAASAAGATPAQPPAAGAAAGAPYSLVSPPSLASPPEQHAGAAGGAGQPGQAGGAAQHAGRPRSMSGSFSAAFFGGAHGAGGGGLGLPPPAHHPGMPGRERADSMGFIGGAAVPSSAAGAGAGLGLPGTLSGRSAMAGGPGHGLSFAADTSPAGRGVVGSFDFTHHFGHSAGGQRERFTSFGALDFPGGQGGGHHHGHRHSSGGHGSAAGGGGAGGSGLDMGALSPRDDDLAEASRRAAIFNVMKANAAAGTGGGGSSGASGRDPTSAPGSPLPRGSGGANEAAAWRAPYPLPSWPVPGWQAAKTSLSASLGVTARKERGKAGTMVGLMASLAGSMPLVPALRLVQRSGAAPASADGAASASATAAPALQWDAVWLPAAAALPSGAAVEGNVQDALALPEGLAEALPAGFELQPLAWTTAAHTLSAAAAAAAGAAEGEPAAPPPAPKLVYASTAATFQPSEVPRLAKRTVRGATATAGAAATAGAGVPASPDAAVSLGGGSSAGLAATPAGKGGDGASVAGSAAKSSKKNKDGKKSKGTADKKGSKAGASGSGTPKTGKKRPRSPSPLPPGATGGMEGYDAYGSYDANGMYTGGAEGGYGGMYGEGEGGASGAGGAGLYGADGTGLDGGYGSHYGDMPPPLPPAEQLPAAPEEMSLYAVDGLEGWVCPPDADCYSTDGDLDEDQAEDGAPSVKDEDLLPGALPLPPKAGAAPAALPPVPVLAPPPAAVPAVPAVPADAAEAAPAAPAAPVAAAAAEEAKPALLRYYLSNPSGVLRLTVPNMLAGWAHNRIPRAPALHVALPLASAAATAANGAQEAAHAQHTLMGDDGTAELLAAGTSAGGGEGKQQELVHLLLQRAPLPLLDGALMAPSIPSGLPPPSILEPLAGSGKERSIRTASYPTSVLLSLAEAGSTATAGCAPRGGHPVMKLVVTPVYNVDAVSLARVKAAVAAGVTALTTQVERLKLREATAASRARTGQAAKTLQEGRFEAYTSRGGGRTGGSGGYDGYDAGAGGGSGVVPYEAEGHWGTEGGGDEYGAGRYGSAEGSAYGSASGTKAGASSKAAGSKGELTGTKRPRSDADKAGAKGSAKKKKKTSTGGGKEGGGDGAGAGAGQAAPSRAPVATHPLFKPWADYTPPHVYPEHWVGVRDDVGASTAATEGGSRAAGAGLGPTMALVPLQLVEELQQLMSVVASGAGSAPVPAPARSSITFEQVQAYTGARAAALSKSINLAAAASALGSTVLQLVEGWRGGEDDWPGGSITAADGTLRPRRRAALDAGPLHKALAAWGLEVGTTGVGVAPSLAAARKPAPSGAAAPAAGGASKATAGKRAPPPPPASLGLGTTGGSAASSAAAATAAAAAKASKKAAKKAAASAAAGGAARPAKPAKEASRKAAAAAAAGYDERATVAPSSLGSLAEGFDGLEHMLSPESAAAAAAAAAAFSLQQQTGVGVHPPFGFDAGTSEALLDAAGAAVAGLQASHLHLLHGHHEGGEDGHHQGEEGHPSLQLPEGEGYGYPDASPSSGTTGLYYDPDTGLYYQLQSDEVGAGGAGGGGSGAE